MSNIVNKALEKVKKSVSSDCGVVNVGPSERALSVVAGGLILAMGVRNLFRSPISSFTSITLGGGLIFRGVTGHCKVKSALEGNDQQKATVVEHRYFVK